MIGMEEIGLGTCIIFAGLFLWAVLLPDEDDWK